MDTYSFTSTGVEPGEYTAEITGVEEDTARHGPVFEVTYLTTEDREISQYYGRRDDGKITPQSKMGKIIKNILDPEPGEEIDTQELVGEVCEIVVERPEGKDFAKVVATRSLEDTKEEVPF